MKISLGFQLCVAIITLGISDDSSTPSGYFVLILLFDKSDFCIKIYLKNTVIFPDYGDNN